MSEGATVRWLADTLAEAYGPQEAWWPAESPFEVCVGAILVQNTTWQQVARAIANLKAAGALNPVALLALPPGAVEDLVRPSGTFRQKARRLEAFCHHLLTRWNADLPAMFAQDTDVLRAELLGIWGIGEETADAIVLFAAHKPAFIVDAYTTRIVRRLGLVSEGGTRHAVHALFTDALPANAPVMRHAALRGMPARCPMCLS
jgi:endonuclease III related protein